MNGKYLYEDTCTNHITVNPQRERERPRETERDRASEPASSTPGFDFVGKMFNKVYRALKHDYGNSSRVLKGACRMEFVKIRESILVESFI